MDDMHLCQLAARTVRNTVREQQNDALMAEANRVAMNSSMSYADAKGTIKWILDGDMSGLERRINV